MPVAGLVAVCLYLPEPALAWEPAETCGGYNVTWPSAFYIRRNTCSISDPGSRYNAISDQMSSWRNVGGMREMVYWSAYQRRTIELDACPGGVWATTFGAGNNGTTTVSFVERFYVSTSSVSWSGNGGTSLSFYNGRVRQRDDVTLVEQFTMPNVGVGTYHLYHAVDYNDQVNEGRETDNVSRHAIPLKVQSWCF